MIIPVEVAINERSGRKLPPSFAQFGTDEIVLVDLQGVLDVEGEMKGQFVGKLSVDDETVSMTFASRTRRTTTYRAEQKKPSLLIGHHLLEGKLVNLPKPLAIMHRVPPEPTEDDPSGLDDDSPTSTSAPPTWKIVAVVKRKMVFAKRPMPMVGKPSSTVTSGKS
ncbi:hypothetical protein NM688_g6471 [Phlebia brevispora]|uniref:Uncharacterized protein n=1 Tax=Phlebia brevispora TaxID=194682 RepID=A0ACC1SFY9_9APHY|nr:hypothetical protein NM688_g6471 [Phlebia brevispora]